MGLIGLGTVTLAALILGVRSSKVVNKALTLLMWGTLVVITAGWV